MLLLHVFIVIALLHTVISFRATNFGRFSVRTKLYAKKKEPVKKIIPVTPENTLVDAELEAFQKCKANADQGNIEAQYDVSKIYLSFDGVHNLAVGYRYIKLAADAGHEKCKELMEGLDFHGRLFKYKYGRIFEVVPEPVYPDLLDDV